MGNAKDRFDQFRSRNRSKNGKLSVVIFDVTLAVFDSAHMSADSEIICNYVVTKTKFLEIFRILRQINPTKMFVSVATLKRYLPTASRE
jgi:hypothetical protein